MIDVLVIGGGNAALCAALMAREAGASVLVLEAAPRAWRGGNSQHTRNLRCMHDAPQDVLVDAYPEEEFWQDLLKVTAGQTDEALARLVIRASASCRDWTTKSIKDANLPLLSNQAGEVLAESKRITHDVSRLLESREVKAILSDAVSVMHGMREIVTDWSEISKQTKLASNRFPEISSRLERSLRHVDMLLAKKTTDIEQTIDSLRVTADNFRELSENGKRYPAQMFLGGPPPQAGSAKR